MIGEIIPESCIHLCEEPNPKIPRTLVFELATARFVSQCEDILLLGPPGTGKSHLVQALGLAAIGQGHRVLYREAHVLIEELMDAVLDQRRKKHMNELATVPLLIIDDLGMRKLTAHAAEDLLEIIMRRYERASTILTSNRPVEDWGTLLGDTAAVTAMLDRLAISSSAARGVGGPERRRESSPFLVETLRDS